MNTLTRRSHLTRSFLLASLLAAANAPAQANPVTTLQLVIGGISLTADLLGIGGTFVDIFGTPNLGTQSDDSPLYTSGGSSPSLTISATDTTFDLLLKQTNNIGEFEDDLLARQNSVLSAHNLSSSDTDTQTHANGPHQDVLTPATLETRWVTLDQFDYVNVRLHAVHAVPEPEAMLLLAAGGLVAGLARRRHAG